MCHSLSTFHCRFLSWSNSRHLLRSIMLMSHMFRCTVISFVRWTTIWMSNDSHIRPLFVAAVLIVHNIILIRWDHVGIMAIVVQLNTYVWVYDVWLGKVKSGLIHWTSSLIFGLVTFLGRMDWKNRWSHLGKIWNIFAAVYSFCVWREIELLWRCTKHFFIVWVISIVHRIHSFETIEIVVIIFFFHYVV